MVAKPTSIKDSEFKSAKWDEITEGRNFKTSDIPALTLLCQWYAVIEKCIKDISINNEVQVAYQNNIGDAKPLPQLSTMKQASAEIRALNKQLGICDGVDEQSETLIKTSALEIVRRKRVDKEKSAKT